MHNIRAGGSGCDKRGHATSACADHKASIAVRDALPRPHDAKAHRRAAADATVFLDSFPQEEDFPCSQCSLVFPNLHDLKTHEGRARGIILSRVQVAKNDHGLHGLPTSIAPMAGAGSSEGMGALGCVAADGADPRQDGRII